MNKPYSLSNLLIKNYLKKLNYKRNILNTLSISIFLSMLIIFFRINVSFSFLLVTQATVFLMIYFKKVLSDFFTFEEYEIYLGFPIRRKEILLAKFRRLNLCVNIETSYILLLGLFFGFLEDKGLMFYSCIVFSYFLVNYVLMIFSFFLGWIFYIIKFSIETKSVIVDYFTLIENIDKKSKKYKNIKLFKVKSILWKIVEWDIKKVLRNKILIKINFFTMILLSIAYVIFLSFILSINDKIPPNGIFGCILIMLVTAVIASSIALLGFSRSGIDHDFVLMMPVAEKTYVTAKIIASIILSIPCILIFGIFIIMLNWGFIYTALSVVLFILATISFTIYGLFEDKREVNLYWITASDLSEGNMYYNKLFRGLGLITVVLGPTYIIPIFLSKMSFIIILIIDLILLVTLGSISYKKLMKLI
ncbi:MAG: hypothetical protein ACRC41_17720 [Sarcina sp.]